MPDKLRPVPSRDTSVRMSIPWPEVAIKGMPVSPTPTRGHDLGLR